MAHFWWATWPKKRKWAIHSFFQYKKAYIKHTTKQDFRFVQPKFLSESLIRSFPLSNLSKSLAVAHLSWATWAIGSRSLISSERPEWFAHGHSFVLSDLSKSLTVNHLIWAKWANSQPWMQHSIRECLAFEPNIWKQKPDIYRCIRYSLTGSTFKRIIRLFLEQC